VPFLQTAGRASRTLPKGRDGGVHNLMALPPKNGNTLFHPIILRSMVSSIVLRDHQACGAFGKCCGGRRWRRCGIQNRPQRNYKFDHRLPDAELATPAEHPSACPFNTNGF